MDIGFAMIAHAIENNPIAPVTRTSPAYIRQEIDRLLACEPSTINHQPSTVR